MEQKQPQKSFVQYARELFPEEYAEVSDKDIATEFYDLIRGAPEAPSEKQFFIDVGIAPSLKEEFGRGVTRGFKTSIELATKAGPAAVTKALGFDQITEDLLQRYDSAVQKIYAENPQSVGSIEDVDGVGSATRLAAGFIGEGVGDLGLSLATFGAGKFVGLAGKQAARAGVKDRIKKTVQASGSAKVTGFKDDALDAALEKSILFKSLDKGGEIGVFSQALGASVGESYVNLVKEGQGDEVDTAFIAGAVKSGLEYIPAIAAIKKVFGGGKVGEAVAGRIAATGLKKIGIDAAQIGLLEGATEAAQQAVDIAAVDFVSQQKDLFTKESLVELVNAGVAGALGGAGAGGLAGAAGQLFSPKQNTDISLDNTLYNKVKGLSSKQKEVDLSLVEEDIDEVYAPPQPTDDEQISSIKTSLRDQFNSTLRPVEPPAAPTQSIRDEFLTAASLDNFGAVQAVRQVAERLSPEVARGPDPAGLASRLKVDFNQSGRVLPPARPLPPSLLGRSDTTITGLKNDFLQEVLRRVPEPVQYSSEVQTPQLTVAPDGRVVSAILPEQFQQDTLAAGQRTPVEIRLPGVDFDVLDARPPQLQSSDQQVQQEYPVEQDVRLQRARGIPSAFPNIPTEPSPLTGPAVPQDFTYDRNLRYLPLTPQSEARLQPIASKILETVKRIAPKADLRFVDVLDVIENDIGASPQIQPVRGAQLGNVLYVALGFNSAAKYDSFETALHETFHFLYNDTTFFTVQEKQLLERETGRITDFLSAEYGLHPSDITTLTGEAGREELFATAFGLYASKTAHGAKATAVLKLGPLNKIFKKVTEFLRNLRNALGREKIRKWEDLFEDVLTRQRALEDVSDALNQQRVARLQNTTIPAMHQQRVSTQIGDFNALQHAEDFKEVLKRAASQSADGTRTFSVFKKVTDWYSSMAHLATQDPFLASIFGLLKVRERDHARTETYWNRRLETVMKDPTTFLNATAVVDLLDATRQELTEDATGRIVYTRGGRTKRLDNKTSDAVKEIHSIFKDAAGLYEDTLVRVASELGVEGVTSPEDIAPAIVQTQAEVKLLREANPDDPLIESKRRRINQLERVRDNLRTAQELKNSKTPYFPHMRFGEYAVSVKEKETGDLVGLYTLNKDFATGKLNRSEYAEIKKDLSERGFTDREKYEVSEVYKLTKNTVAANLDPGSGAFNLELISSLVSSVDSSNYAEIVSKLEADSRMRGFAKFLRERKPTPVHGYSKDYARVLPAYFSSFSRFLTNQKFAVHDAAIRARIEAYQGDTHWQNEVRKYVDYYLSPEKDAEFLRAFNFMYALGGNPSSAVLQLMTSMLVTPAQILQFRGNPLSVAGIVSDSLTLSGEIIKESNFNIEKILQNKDAIQKIVKDPALAEFLYSLRAEQVLTPALVEDFIGGKQFATGTVKGKLLNVSKTAGKVLGLPIGIMEELSRVSTAIAAFKALSSPEAIKKAEKVYSNDQRFQKALAIERPTDMRKFIATYIIDETHGIFGKLGRNSNQRGLMGGLLFPFMSFVMQTSELMFRMAFRRGAEGRSAVLAIVALSLLFGGLQGLPFEELVKEVIEKGHQLATSREIDLDFELRKALVNQFEFSPRTALWIQKGAFAGAGDADISRRIQIPTFMQPLLVSLLKGNTDITSFSGPAGSAVGNLANNVSALARGDQGLASFLVSSLTPVSLQNLWEAAILYPNQGARTAASGNPLVAADEFTMKELLLKATGFSPVKVSEAYMYQNAQRLGKYGHVQGMNTYRRKIVNLEQERLRAERQGDSERVSELSKRIKDLASEAVNFSERAGKPMDSRSIKAFNKSVQDQLKKRDNPRYDPRPAKYAEDISDLFEFGEE